MMNLPQKQVPRLNMVNISHISQISTIREDNRIQKPGGTMELDSHMISHDSLAFIALHVFDSQ